MGRVKSRKLKSENEKESSITFALTIIIGSLADQRVEAILQSCIAYTTLQRRVHGGQRRVAAHESQQLVTVV